jgi:molybdopterin molybdotransferase
MGYCDMGLYALMLDGVALKPGKPTLFARRVKAGGGAHGAAEAAAYSFGLPGNPVSAFVIFEVFVKPLLYRLQGLRYAPRTVRARLAESFQRRDAERVELRPVRLERGGVRSLVYHGSAHLNALSGADGLLRLEAGVSRLEEGTWTDVRLL